MFSTVIIFVSFYLCGASYAWTVAKMGFAHIYDLAALPVLMLYLSFFGLLMMPVTNSISRRYEYQADGYALTQRVTLRHLLQYNGETRRDKPLRQGASPCR